MRWCNRQMTVLQRRSMQQLGGVMGLTAGVTLLSRDWFKVGQTPMWAAVVAVVSVLPVLAMIGIVGRYLASEPDEFIRALATRALLWGLAVTMVGDAVVGALMQMYGGHLTLVVLNADLLFVGTGVAFRVLQRGYRLRTGCGICAASVGGARRTWQSGWGFRGSR